jgi:iron complex transport system permease protein
VTNLLTLRRLTAVLLSYGLVSLAVVVVAPLLGTEEVSVSRILGGLFSSATNVDFEIFFYHRIPRVILAFAVGGSLAVAGAALQVALRNPLAEPFILGVSGGGAVGAVLAISVPGLFFRVGPLSTVQVFSLAGCVMAISVIYRVASRIKGVSMATILLAGVTINILCGAAILLIRYLASPHLLVAMDRWIMGGLDVVGYGELLTLAPLLIPGLVLLFYQGHALNLLALGGDMAAGHGVQVAAVQKRVIIGMGLITAAAVSLSGPIGFVGLIIPHAVRRLSGADHRVVLPASFCLGGAFLTLCDLLARTVVAPTEMPVGIITAIVGGPVFIRILLRHRG